MCNTFRPSWLLLAVLVLSSAYVAASVGSPLSDCYSVDKDGYLYDFTDLKGKEFRYSDQDGLTYVIRLCKDVQVKTSQFTENLGRFSPAQFSAQGSKSFVQEYRYGDLRGCEGAGYDSSGRSSTVTILCEQCHGGNSCQDPDGCICYVKSNPSRCLTSMMLGLNCKNRGPKVVNGFTVGFNPRGKEVVDNGITQWGYDNSYSDYSFSTRQSRVVLYLSAESTLASKIGKPEINVFPEKGLKVQLSGTATNGEAPATVLSPAVLEIDWRCEKRASMPYLVKVTIPVGEYDPILFTLGKQCDYEDDVERSGSSGWASFGVFIFVVIVMLTMFCCAGFLYKSRIEDKHGLDALPGFSAFASFIESTNDRYAPANDVTNITISHNGSSSSSGNHSARLPRSSDGPSYGAI